MKEGKHESDSANQQEVLEVRKSNMNKLCRLVRMNWGNKSPWISTIIVNGSTYDDQVEVLQRWKHHLMAQAQPTESHLMTNFTRIWFSYMYTCSIMPSELKLLKNAIIFWELQNWKSFMVFQHSTLLLLISWYFYSNSNNQRILSRFYTLSRFYIFPKKAF